MIVILVTPLAAEDGVGVGTDVIAHIPRLARRCLPAVAGHSPPSVAVVPAMLVTVGEVTVGGTVQCVKVTRGRCSWFPSCLWRKPRTSNRCWR